MPFKPRRICVLYSLDYWTPVVRAVFQEVLPRLGSAYCQVLFLVLYDKLWHSRDGKIFATPTDMAGWIGADQRTVDACLSELARLDFVIPAELGRRSSRTNKPRWEIPVTQFDFATEGPWTPVPRFFIHEYPKAFPKSILLAVLLWHQHLNWKNDCWPGVTRLATLTGWSKRSVYQALNTMGHEHRWERLGLSLPWPLQIRTNRDKQGNEHRHFSVRAVFYAAKKGRGRSTVMVTQEFAKFFHIRTGRNFVGSDNQNDD